MTFNFNGVNRTKHNKARQFPSRRKLLLRNAIEDTGLKVIEYEYMIQDPALPYWIWFDAAVEIKGRIVFIFLYDEHVSGKLAYKYKPLNVRARQRKVDYAREHGIPYIEVRFASQDRIRAQIEMALMFLDKKPYIDAPNPMPAGWRVIEVKRPFKGRRLV